MMYHFSIYSGGSTEAVQAELSDLEAARAKACGLLDYSTRGAGVKVTCGQQVRVVVSDDQGLDLFTLAFVSSFGEVRHDISKRQSPPVSPFASEEADLTAITRH